MTEVQPVLHQEGQRHLGKASDTPIANTIGHEPRCEKALACQPVSHAETKISKMFYVGKLSEPFNRLVCTFAHLNEQCREITGFWLEYQNRAGVSAVYGTGYSQQSRCFQNKS